VRAWLPPSSLWLFAPREETHNVGGWSFEFYDHRAPRQQRGKLHPAVLVLLAAFHSLDRERGKRSGMLHAASGALAWLRSRVTRRR
jgi:hypothetical protein